MPPTLSIGPSGPINSGVIKEALFRYADSLLAGSDRYRAVTSILQRDTPRITGLEAGAPLLPEGRVTTEAIADLVLRLDGSYLFLQGPPGAGKTYTGSHLIVSLLQAGKSVGVTSNAHKPIHNLLAAVVEVAAQRGFALHAVKKANKESPETVFDGGGVINVFNNDDVFASGAGLIAGTAWLFSRCWC